ncbi:MAG: hypothetical protein IKJ78_04030 [Bacteroidales bacterium]|nr:hypothetical protein [Bacteroidales bacterium]
MAKKLNIRDVYSGRRDVLTDTEYNHQMQLWSETVQKMAKLQATAFQKGKKKSHTYKSGPKKGTTETILRNHIQYQLKTNAGEVAGVAFQFPVHGIFREYGVGRGTPRALVGHTSRSMSDWLSGTLQRQESRLLDIVADQQAGKVVRLFGGVVK